MRVVCFAPTELSSKRDFGWCPNLKLPLQILKKAANHRADVALHFIRYNFVRQHKNLRARCDSNDRF